MPVLTQERRSEHILEATINRPETHNAINFAVMDALEDLLHSVEEDQQIRCLILRGAGSDAFISGGDLNAFHTLQTAEEAEPMARRMRAILERIEQLPCWAIACINGDAFGGGCEMMLAFDFRIASRETSFGFTQGRFYLPPGWGGLTRLVERVGRATALRWLAETAIVNSTNGLAHGLIDRVAEPEELSAQTLEWAERLSQNDRDYIKVLKKRALHVAQGRWESIEEELPAFLAFWEDSRHHARVERFLSRKADD